MHTQHGDQDTGRALRAKAAKTPLAAQEFPEREPSLNERGAVRLA
jgi:hypothetical protein